MAKSVAEGREIARKVAFRRVLAELKAAGVAEVEIARGNVISLDRERARSTAESFVRRVFRRASKSDVPPRDAVRTALRGEQRSVDRIAATETSRAFNDERRRVVQAFRHRVLLYRVWDAELDKRTCPICRDADGVAVPVGEPFSAGQPGDVHPWCRCQESYLPVELLGETTQEAA